MHGEGRADDSSLHLLGYAQLGFTDNVLSAPRNPPAGIDGPQWDAFVGVRPGILFTYGTPRAIHELTYSLDANLYARKTDFSTIFQRAGWRGFFLLSPRSEVITTVAASFGNSNLLTTSAAASAGQVGAVRSGMVETLGGDVGEDYSYLVSPSIRFTQGLTARYDRSSTSGNGVSTGSEIGARFGLDKSFQFDALAVTAGASYLSLSRPMGGVTDATTDHLVNARGGLMYRRDVSRYWNAVADGGVVAVLPAGGVGKTTVVPVAGASLGYTPAWGSASVAVRRDVSPNLLIARNTQTTSAVATCWLPLPWLANEPTNPELSVQGTLGFSRTKLIDSDLGEVVSGFDDVLGDLALNWNFRKNAGLSLRYQLIWQTSTLSTATPDTQVFGFVRDTVLIQVFGRWPDRLAVEVPVRQSLRVDRSNVTPVGEEIQSGQGGGNR